MLPTENERYEAYTMPHRTGSTFNRPNLDRCYPDPHKLQIASRTGEHRTRLVGACKTVEMRLTKQKRCILPAAQEFRRSFHAQTRRTCPLCGRSSCLAPDRFCASPCCNF